MITWLPSADFEESAKMLSDKKLHLQVIDNRCIMQVITGKFDGMKPDNPAILQWAGYPHTLYTYALTVVVEGMSRGACGYWDIESLERQMAIYEGCIQEPTPPWLGVPEYHQSHADYIAWDAVRGAEPIGVHPGCVVWPVTKYGDWWYTTKDRYHMVPFYNERPVARVKGYTNGYKYRLTDFKNATQCACCHYWHNPSDLFSNGECAVCVASLEERQLADELRGIDDDECRMAARNMDLVVQTRVRLAREGSLMIDLEEALTHATDTT